MDDVEEDEIAEYASAPCQLAEYGGLAPAPAVYPARMEEADEIARVLVASIRELCAADHKDDPLLIESWTANKTAEQVSDWIADPAQTVLVSREGTGGPIACVGAASAEWILLNYVHPASRGRGHSRAMLAALERAVAGRGSRAAHLMSTETAHDFYRAAGWRDVGTAPCVGAGTLRGHRMVKDLAS